MVAGCWEGVAAAALHAGAENKWKNPTMYRRILYSLSLACIILIDPGIYIGIFYSLSIQILMIVSICRLGDLR